MEHTLLIGDHFFVETATWALGRTPKRGEMVAFHYPVDRKEVFIKRIAGIPGDRVSIRNKQLYVNGSPASEPYAIHTSDFVDAYRDNFPSEPTVFLKEQGSEMLRTALHAGEIVVPGGAYFVLGDNRDSSLDSRYWGFVKRQDIFGSPVLIYASYDVSTVDHASPGTAMPPTILRMRWARMFKMI